MIITSFDRIVGVGRMAYMPLCRYVVSDHMFMNLSRAVEKDKGRVLSQSSFNSYLRPYGGIDLSGKTILINRHTAFGDQLIVTALCRYLKYRFPTCTIIYFSEPGVVDIWMWNPDIIYCGGPIPLETAKNCNYHMFIRGMFENDSEPDQDNCYDAMFRYAGFEPEEVPSEYKRPHLFFNEDDERCVREIRQENGKYIVYQWQASNPNRTYPIEQSIATLQLLAENLPDYRVIIVGSGENTPNLPFQKGGQVINMVNKTPQFRTVLHLVKGAQLVICPDSSVGHVAGAFPDVPCISLWGLFHPNDRVKYYDNHFTLTGFDVCPHAPCHDHHFELPVNKCKEATNNISPPQYCNALRSITPEKIVSLAISILCHSPQIKHSSSSLPSLPNPSENLNDSNISASQNLSGERQLCSQESTTASS